MKLEQIIKLKQNDFKVEIPVATGDKPANVQEAENNKRNAKIIDLAKYPWDECIADQVARYGDEETAAKICGWIKANYQEMAEEDGLENACWPGYEAIGTKELDGRMVPNCVPMKQ